MDRVWGIEGLAPLAADLDAYGRGEREFDVLGLQVLWEHKRMMVARTERCLELGADVEVLLPRLRRMERQAWTLRTMMLETLDGDRGSFGREAVALLEEITAGERSVLPEPVTRLRKAVNRVDEGNVDA
ncbi:hypothetical protein OG596_07325 [Streptomyces sp. NBC_01102]|uniref:hypothetical protein n=1 Tax=unclassified Streptomyces TaxID=2593676 RepID=UPI003862D96B|nr:hypothetical protein OG596_07325 [Streptomyces sp. NBC_01102]